MKKKNILVLGEKNWELSPKFNVYCEKVFSNTNLKYSKDNSLLFLNTDFSWIKIDGIIWRGQFESESTVQRYLLEIIKLSGVECINDPDVGLNHGSNFSMYNALLNEGLPIVKKEILTFGQSTLDFHEPSFPTVLKVGNYHMGYGKAIIRNIEAWRDFIDMAVLLNQPISLEPYINYKTDIRCLYIGGKIQCFERKPSHWKANVSPVELITYNPSDEILEKTSQFAQSINADIIGLDWILGEDGKWLVLEGNTSPGLINFEVDCHTINELLFTKINNKS